MSDKVREGFEAWCRSLDGVLPPDALPIEWGKDGLEPIVHRDDGEPGHIGLECEWAAWQASRRAALEEAADIAQQRANVCAYATHGADPKVVAARVETAMCIKGEIRTLAGGA